VTFVLSWVVYPLLVVALSLGIGLLLRRLAGSDALPGVLVVPVGFAGIVALVVFPTQLDATAELAGVLVLAVAVGGFLLTGRGLLTTLRPTRAWLWPALAALLPAAAIAAPIVLTGQPGLTGYGRIVDTAHQLDLTAWLTSEGRRVPVESMIDSSYLRQAFQTIDAGYPGGAQATLGATSGLIGVDPVWTYQVFLAVLGAVLGLALFSLLGRAIPSAPWRAVAAGVAAQPTILYSYALAGGIKELGAVVALAVVAAVLLAHPPSGSTIRQLVPIAVAAAASLAIFNLGIVPVRTVGRWAALGVLTLVITIPTLLVAVRLAPTAAGGGPPDLGNLAAPVSGWSAVGPWLNADYRFALDVIGYPTLTYVFVGIVLALAALGLAWAIARFDLRLLALAVTAGVALVYVTDRSGPWFDLKAFIITAPITLALAFAGAWTISRWRRVRWLGPAAVVLVAVTVLAGNAMVYRGTTITPYERFAELEELGERYAGQGPALLPSFEEFGEYLLRDTKATGIGNAPQSRFVLSPSARPEMVFSRDPDEIALDFLDEFDLLFLRRDPTGSRPPSNWRLEERTDFYEVWRRQEDAPEVLAHFPLQGSPGERADAFCADVRATVRAAQERGAWIAYAQAPSVVQYTAQEGDGPASWEQLGPDFRADGPGRLEGQVTLPIATRYTLWLRGSIGRQVRVLVDGEEVGSLRWAQSYPQQYAPVGSIELPAGVHTFEIVRGGGTLLPGTSNVSADGFTTTVGPLAFAFSQPGPRVSYAQPGEFGEMCRSEVGLDWVEVLAPPAPGQETGDDEAT
jgi:hypothetical protein